jgi:RNA polymerase sigma-70 factor (ECF subfamily)
MINDEELFIFNRVVDGDKEAFRFFFEKYYPDLCNLVNIYVHDAVASEEIVQDIFIYLWEKKETIKISSSVKSYLFQASKNKSLNYLRDERKKLDIHQQLSSRNNIDTEQPDSVMNANQLQEIIENAINKLPERSREIYLLAKEKKLSYKEIAQKLDISVKTVETQMSRALKSLREQLKPYYNDMFIFFLSCIINRLL